VKCIIVVEKLTQSIYQSNDLTTQITHIVFENAKIIHCTYISIEMHPTSEKKILFDKRKQYTHV